MSIVEIGPIEREDVQILIKERDRDFQMCKEYVHRSPEIYLQDRSLWLSLSYENKIVGLMCCLDDRFEPDSLHISLLEISPECRGKLLGSTFLTWVIENATSVMANAITLQIQKPELIPFYEGFGFTKTEDSDGVTYYRLVV